MAHEKNFEVEANETFVVKVIEPLESEYGYSCKGLLIFIYFHLAADAPLTRALMDACVIAMAYETIQDKNRSLPCLYCMSNIAGHTAVV